MLELDQKIAQVYKLIKECEALAEEANIEFSLRVGRTYIPSSKREEWGYDEDELEDGWWTPSRNC